MKIGRVALMAGLLAMVPATTNAAGDYLKSKDFAGQISWVYKPSGALLNRYTVYLAKYDPNSETLRMLIKISKTSDIECGNQFPLLIKTANGEVHRLQGEAKGEPPVCFATVQADWVKSKFTLRVYTVNYLGMRPESKPHDAEFDTSNLDLARIAIAPAVASNETAAATSDNSIAESSSPDVGSAQHSCVGGAGGDASAFRVQVANAEWTDRILRPGMEMVPPAQLQMMGERAYLLPQVGFLVVTLQVTNTKNSPMEFFKEDSHAPAFFLQSSQGAQLQPVKGVGDLFRKTEGGLNPGIPARGTIVFDVPRDNYQFEVYWLTTRGKNRVYDCALLAE